VTVTVYVPGDTPPTKKLPLGAPLPAVIVHNGVVGRVLGPILQKVSPNEKPVPVKVTDDPSPPVLGERVILADPGEAPVTLNAAVPEMSPLLPWTWTRYVPGVAVFATVKLLPVNAPEPVIVHETEAKRTGLAGDCKKLHKPASAVLKPLPVTETGEVTGPDVGDNTMFGPVTVNPA